MLRGVGLALIIIFAVVMGAFAAVAFVAKKELDAVFTPTTAEMKETVSHLEAALPGKPTNVLVLGSDYRAGDDPSERRSDTMLVVRLDPRGKTISMLSIPRDLYVDIPGHGKSKINDAYTYGGPALSVETIKQLTGLDVNFVANVDFKGFRGLVESVGGVWVDVDHHYLNKHDGTENTNFAEIDIQPGYQLLSGRDALAFARYRHGDTDFHRIARQQQTLAALKEQVSGEVSIKHPGEVLGLFKVISNNVQIAGGGDGKGVDTKIILDYLRLALKLDAKDIYQVEVVGGYDTTEAGASIVVADPATIRGAVEAFLNPSEDAREKTADQVTGQKGAAATRSDEQPAQPAAPEPADTTVTVLNGGGVDGAAGTMTEQLRGIGYEVVLPDNGQASQFPGLANTVVQYRRPNARTAAEALAGRIEGASAEPADGSNRFDTQLLLVVGKVGTTATADGESPVGTDTGPVTEYGANVVPEKSAPKVATDPQYGRDEFAALGNVGFPLLYPTVRESTSTYEEPVKYSMRVGKHGRYGAYRIIAKTSEGYFWGVQGTSWPDPPILASPTRSVKKGSRSYDLYFVGTKLHLVAWHQGVGTYWVANTVLNDLSPETMLAIAEGVKPL